MILYAESSAVLAWLLAEPEGEDVARILAGAAHVIVSDLLFVECDRARIRAETIDALSAPDSTAVRTRLVEASAHWTTMRVSAPVVDRSRQPFPVEPIRSLDAIHLASALEARAVLPELRITSLDGRVRDNAARLGFELAPDG